MKIRLLLPALVLVLSACSSPQTIRATPAPSSDSITACIMTQMLIEKNLSTPHAVAFAPCHKSVVRSLPNNRYSVQSYVDIEDGPRVYFTAQVYYTGNAWRLEDFDLQ